MEDAIYALIPIVFILSVAGVMVLRPISKRLGTLLEVYGQDRLAARSEERQIEALRDRLESLDQRLDSMEERMGFTEELVGRRPTPRVAAPDAPAPTPRVAGS